ncbi:MAG TPA: hypothetical protein VLA91_14985 [Acidimicrobiia bacterium]|nr:hypothetical protein [Acidimicrobiia bacterium]
MYARVTTVQGPPESADASLKVIREQILPRARDIAGFKGILSLVNRETGKGLTATFWESVEAMKASEEAADKLRDQAVGAVDGSELVSVERYEVELDER